MRETIYAPITPDRVGDHTSARPRTDLHVPMGIAVATTGLALGIVADRLFWDGLGTVSFALWIALFSIALVALVWRDQRRVPRESAFWLLAAALFATCLTWRDSDLLQFFDVVATLGCAALAVVRLRDSQAGILAERMRDTAFGVVRAGVTAAFGLLPLAMRELVVPGKSSSLATRTRTTIRLALLAIVILLVFGSLLRGADPIFASIATIPALDFGSIIGHTLTILFVAAVVAGWSRSALLPASPTVTAPSGFGFSLGAAEVTTILGTLNLLFAAFVVAQLGWFFGGEQFLRARTGLTAAQYARGGFFQMLWVVALVVPVLVVTRSALRDGHALARRHTMLALPIVALLGVMIVCSMARLQLYVTIYGLTTDRLYPLVFMAWLFAILLWLGMTILRDWSRPFALGVALSAMTTLLTLHALDPDAFVARVNVERAAHPLRADAERLDVEYLAELSGRAVPIAVNAVLAPQPAADDAKRCVASRRLIERFGPARQFRGGGPTDVDARWRYWNSDDAVATRAVSEHFFDLLAVRHATCAAVRATTGARV